MQAAAKPAAPMFDKLICIGKNYLEHAKELGDAVPDKPGARAARWCWQAGTCMPAARACFVLCSACAPASLKGVPAAASGPRLPVLQSLKYEAVSRA
jgi:hypothetical protein